MLQVFSLNKGLFEKFTAFAEINMNIIQRDVCLPFQPNVTKAQIIQEEKQKREEIQNFPTKRQEFHITSARTAEVSAT